MLQDYEDDCKDQQKKLLDEYTQSFGGLPVLKIFEDEHDKAFEETKKN